MNAEQISNLFKGLAKEKAREMAAAINVKPSGTEMETIKAIKKVIEERLQAHANCQNEWDQGAAIELAQMIELIEELLNEIKNR